MPLPANNVNPAPPKNGLLGLPIVTGDSKALIGDDLKAINAFQAGVDIGLARVFCPVVTVATANVALNATAVNGLALKADDNVVLAGQTAVTENGVYTFKAGALTRHAAFPVGAKLNSEVFTDMQQGRDRVSYVASGTIGTDAMFKPAGGGTAAPIHDAVVFSGTDGDITAGADLLNAILPYGMKLPANCAGSFLRVNGTAPTAAAVFEVKKNATVIQTITVASGQRTGTFANSAEVSFAAGDLLTVTAKTPSGSTKVSFTFTTTRL